MNPNKLFPRLSIRWKLAIAFVILSGFPLVVVGVMGIRSATMELRFFARANLQHDLQLVEENAIAALIQVGQHSDLLAEVGVERLRPGAGKPGLDDFEALTQAYLDDDPSPIFRVHLLDETGTVVASVARTGAPPLESRLGLPLPLYEVTAAALEPGERAFIPVELRTDSVDRLAVIPAVTVVRGVFHEGAFIGSVAAEAETEKLLGGLEITSPDLEGVTGLVNAAGHLLYHSELKEDWSELLSADPISLTSFFSEETSAGILDAQEPSLFSESDGLEVAARPLVLDDSDLGRLVLFRAVPIAGLDARVTETVQAFMVVGILILLATLGFALLAADQITHPILRLQRAAHALAAGGMPTPVTVETNDELEDLADDFNSMAESLGRHRSELESLVEERTTRLLETQARLTQLVGSSADGIVGLDADGRIELWNRGAEDLFGFTADEALGSDLTELLGDGTETEGRYFREELGSRGSVVGYHARRRTKDGVEMPVSLTMTRVLDPDGEAVGCTVIYRDDRPRLALEEQMRRSERLAAVSLMAAGLAHELNNPLSVLGNRIELMQRDAVARDEDPRLLKDLEVLGKHVGRIGSITEDLLRFARDDGEEVTCVDVNSVVGRVVRLLDRVFVAAGLELDVRPAEDLPTVRGNENILETVIVNLLLNARNATPSRGRVVLETLASGSAVKVEVRDSGPGVPPELRRRIFEPFFTTRADRGGTGLGLAVCRALTDRLGGTLEVGDAAEGGARFILSVARDDQRTA